MAVFNEHIATPVFAVGIPEIGHGITGENQPQRPALGSGAQGVFGADFVQDMSGYAMKILHHLDRLTEDVGIDPLERIMQQSAALIERNLVSVVDMAGAEGNRDYKISVNMEMRANVPKFILHDPNADSPVFPRRHNLERLDNIASSPPDCKKTAPISGHCRKYSIFFGDLPLLHLHFRKNAAFLWTCRNFVARQKKLSTGSDSGA
ncbi:hypothetical protein SDC9_168539 [bioreactor metagenome]|uniref:Uncharacterized protein n=1 Tax=bioreactor metagenome TaxID=1076179 RepID=A0A645G5G2_9ZZZZ